MLKQLARVLPPPSAGSVDHVVFTTPHIVRQPGLSEWQAYRRRHLPVAAPSFPSDGPGAVPADLDVDWPLAR